MYVLFCLKTLKLKFFKNKFQMECVALKEHVLWNVDVDHLYLPI